MYLVTKRTPSKVVFTENWASKFNAQIRVQMINATCDEYCGGLMEFMPGKDLTELPDVGREFETEWEDYEDLSEINGTMWLNSEIALSYDIILNYDIDSGGVTWKIETCNYTFVDENYDAENMTLPRDLRDELNTFVLEGLHGAGDIERYEESNESIQAVREYQLANENENPNTL